MDTGFDGTFVIPWSHSWIDGQRNPPEDALEPGAVWAWQGTALRVDQSAMQRRGTRWRRKMPEAEALPGDDSLRGSFVVTDGLRHYAIARIETRAGQPDLLMFQGRLPPRDRRLWVIDCTFADPQPGARTQQTGIGEGTLIDTPNGLRPIETLHPGDLIETHTGPQPLLWSGLREIGAAELYLSPSLRPYRTVTETLIAGPCQGVLHRDAALNTLFGVPQALVMMADMPDGAGYVRDLVVDTVRLWHLLLPEPAVLKAGGVWAESFVPEKPALERLGAAQRLQVQSALSRAPNTGGQAPFRRLTKAEAAIALSRAA